MENAKKLSLGIEAVIWGGEENIPLIEKRKIDKESYTQVTKSEYEKDSN